MTTSTDALVLVDKPAGVTSFDVVRAVGKCLGTKKTGHTGTLDPFATGLLVVLTGRGTRLIRYVPGEPKVYLASIAFGSETDTDDNTGHATRAADLPAPDALQDAMTQLTGTFDQTPPAYSARKVDGVRAYALARQGAAPDLAPTPVTVHRWDVLDFDGAVLTARITCGGGTYIRALARDLGRLTRSAAHLSVLRRERNGPWSVDDAVPLQQVRDGDCRPQLLAAALQPSMTSIAVDEATVRALRQGRSVTATQAGDPVALLDDTGDVVAVARRAASADLWLPECVLAT